MTQVTLNVFQYLTGAGACFMARIEHDARQIRRKGFLTAQQAKDGLTTFCAERLNQKYFPERVQAPALNAMLPSP